MQSKSGHDTYISGEPVEHAVERLAAGQHGLVTLAQLRQLGLSRSAVHDRVARGQWVSAAPAVLRITSSTPSWESRLLAHILAIGGQAVASHRSAAALWGLEAFERTFLEISVPRSRNPKARLTAFVHRSSDLVLDEPVMRSGIPTTSVGRTLLDLCAVAGRSRVETALDDALRRGLIDWDGLVDTLARHTRRGRDGVGRLRTILTDRLHSPD